jgi:hypothetical protein
MDGSIGSRVCLFGQFFDWKSTRSENANDEIIPDVFAYSAAYVPQTTHRPLPTPPSCHNPLSIPARTSCN